MRAINRRLTILSDTERAALYELPDFDETQRQQFLQFTESEQLTINCTQLEFKHVNAMELKLTTS